MATLNRGILQKLAEQRLEDARILFKGRRYSAAYYIAGYAVECALKACFAKQVKAHDFPEKGKADKVFTHDLDSLVRVAGLETELKKKVEADGKFDVRWNVVKEWTVNWRYNTLGLTDPIDPDAMKNNARDLIDAIENVDHGVLQWLKQIW